MGDFQNMICGPLARGLIERKVVERMIFLKRRNAETKEEQSRNNRTAIN